MNFLHIDGKKNPVNIMSKLQPYSAMEHLIEPIINWRGDSLDYLDRLASDEPTMGRDEF